MAAASPQIRAQFPAAGLELSNIISAQIRMSDYTHDVALLNLAGSPLNWVTGSPVHITWGTATQAGRFVGYLDHAAHHAVGMQDGIQVVCVGVSYPMKQAGQQIWTETTASSVALEIADRYRLDGDITPHDRIFPSIVQSGESDWQLLVRIAKSIGYSVYVHQTQLRFHPRSRDFLAYQATAAVYNGPDIMGFRAVMGDAVPTDDGIALATRQISAIGADGDPFIAIGPGVDPLAGSYAHTPAFTSISNAVVDSGADALATLAAQSELNRWHYCADAVVPGDVTLRQDLPVYLGGLPADNNGYWCILQAEHRIEPRATAAADRYTVALSLGRDSRGQSLTRPTAVAPTRALDPNTGQSDVSRPRLLGTRWVSDRMPGSAIVEDEQPDFVRDRLADRG